MIVPTIGSRMTTAIQAAFAPSDSGPRTMSTTPITHTITTGMAMNQIIKCSVLATPREHKVARLLWAGGAHTTVGPPSGRAQADKAVAVRALHGLRARA